MTEFFYYGFNPKATAGDEIFGVAIGRLYFGVYKPGYFPWYQNVCLGITDQNGNLD